MFLSQNDLDWFFRPEIGSSKVNRYPLTNVGIDDENVLYIEIAVAGFERENINIEVKGSELLIKGTKEEETKIKYIQQHISSSNFERILSLHSNYVNGKIDASLTNGILIITVKPANVERNLISIK